MRKTTNYGLALYDLEDKMSITAEENSLNASMIKIDNALKEKADNSNIPTKVSELENDKGFISSIPSEYVTETELNNKGYLTQHQDLSSYAKTTDIPTKVSELDNDKNYLTSIPSEYVTDSELNAKNYLTNVPSDYKTKTENDSLYQPKGNYLTSYTESDPTVPSHVKNIKESDISNWDNKSTFSGSYNDLTNKPTLFSGNYNDLTNKPTIPTVPTNVSAFTNDSGYLTSVTKTNIVSVLGYTPANDDDVKEIQDEIGEVETDEDLTSLFNYYEGYLNTTGAAVSHSGAGCTDFISVNVGDVFIWSGSIDPKYNYAICEYNASKDFISGDALITESYTMVYGVKYTVKSGAYVRVCTLSKSKSSLVKTKEYIGINVINNKTDEYMANATAGYINKTNGQFVSDSNSRVTDFIPVNSGDIFLVSAQARYNTCGVAYYNASKTFISSSLCNSDSTAYVASAEQITIPSGVSYARFGTYGYSTYPVIVQKLEQLPLKHSVQRLSEMMNEVQPAGNYLAGKKYVSCGDSFTEGDFTNYVDANGKSAKNSDAYDSDMKMYKTYPYWIAKRNSMTLVNEAKCGSDFTNIEGASNPFSVDRYKAIPTDADYITIMFGLNETSIGDDSSLIGTSSDTTNTTLWGAYNIVFEYLITNMPYAKIGVIIPDAWMTTNYSNAVKEICKYWGIPCLDLKGDDSVPMLIGGRYDAVSSKAKSLRNSAFQVSSSDSHPNLEAHKYRSTIIENFIRSL